MPARNTIKIDAQDYYYHVYNRGANKQVIFHDEDDYSYFLYLFKRHLSKKPVLSKFGQEYRHLYGQVELVAYCLMPNHFHLMIYNSKPLGMELLMRSVMTAYSMFYNKKYDHSGRLFQGIYKASMVDNEAYLQHICRYIHRNPENYASYPYSSYRLNLRNSSTEWLSNKLLTDIFDSPDDYKTFVKDYEGYNKTKERLHHHLANEE